MAYTAIGTFNDAILSDEDKLKIANFKKAYSTATNQQQKDDAHAGAEAIRANYGYSGGGDGTQYIKLEQQPKEQQQIIDPMAQFTTYQNQLKEQQKQAAIASLSKTYNDTISSLNSEKSAIQPAYYNKKNQASSQSQLGAINFAEYLANRGLTSSGSAAQGEINRTTQLQNDINNLNQQEQQAYDDIARRTTQAQQAYNSDLANANAGIEADALKNMMSEWQRVQTQKAEDNKWQQQFDYTKERDNVGDSRYSQEYIDKSKQQEWENTFNQSQFNYQKERDSVADKQWQQNMNLDLRQQTFAEAQAKIENALSQRRISQEDASQALQWARFNADQDPNSLDNQYKKEQIKALQLQNSGVGANYDYKTDPDFADDMEYVAKNPSTALGNLQTNASDFIKKYGIDGYNTLLKAAKGD